MTDSNIEVPEGNVESKEIPVTYVPARNMIFLSLQLHMQSGRSSKDIFIGVSEVDYSGYVDCRQEFLDAMEKTINLGTVCGAEEGKK